MPRPLLPPKGMYYPAAILFNSKMRPVVRDTLVQLLGLAWATNGRCTPPLTYARLAQVTGKSQSSLYGHITALWRDHAALRLQSAGDGYFTIHFAEWVQPKGGKQAEDFENLNLPVKEEEQVSQSCGEKLVLDPDLDHGARKVEKRRLSPELLAAFEAVSLFPRLIAEAAASDYSEDDLRALLAWAREDFPEHAAQIFIARMREHGSAPERFYGEPCKHCGLYGRHAPDCSGRYYEGWDE
jgi:hypothetical protein